MVLTSENFDQEVLKSEIPVLVDFWAAWCYPCMNLSPIVDEITKDLSGKIKVGKVNIDDEPALAEKYNISVIPTLVFFEKGKIRGSAVGMREKEDLIDWLES